MIKVYRGFKIRKKKDGWFGEPENMDCNKERWGCTPTLNSKIEVEIWIDNLLDNE